MRFGGDTLAFLRDFARVDAPWTVRTIAAGRFAAHHLHRLVRKRPLVVRWESLWLELPMQRTPAARAYYFGRPDRWEYAFEERFLRRGGLAIDVGAGDGVQALFLARVLGASGEVIALERDEAALAAMATNAALNELGQLTVLPVTPEGDAPAAYPLLDDVCGERDPDFIVIEAAGEEVAILAGADALMARGTPLAWLIEVPRGRPAETGYLAALLERRGYRFCVYDLRTNTLRRRDWRNPRSRRLLAVRDVEEVTSRIREERPELD
ncbi:MAG: hypothetical protein U0547_08085 [Dehalococcoidia bacterium]